jgi:hypothetical protein
MTDWKPSTLVLVGGGLAAAILGYRWWSSRTDTAPVPGAVDVYASDHGGDHIVPAAMAGSEGALPLTVSVADSESGRRVSLGAGEGTAILTLKKPEPKAETVGGFGRCTLEAPDRKAGAAFLAAVAKWLEVPIGPPAQPENPLVPAPCTYAVLGGGKDPSGRQWLVRKLFFETRSDSAEVYLRMSADDKRAELLEKDPDYRQPLVTAFASALRDGPAPRRTTATDPNLASDAPLVTALAPLAGADAEVGSPTWAGDRLLAVRRSNRDSVLLVWDKLDQAPRELAHIEGRVYSLHADPTHARVAVIVLFPDADGSISSNSPGSATVVEIPGGRVVPLHPRESKLRVGMLSFPWWSPRGDQLALAVEREAGDGGTEGRLTLVYDAATATRIDATAPELGARPNEWTSKGLELEHIFFEAGDRETKRKHWLWQPGKSAPVPVEGPEPPATEARSPDGRFGVRVRDKGLLVTGEGGERRFTSARVDDQDAIESLASEATWIGGAGLLLRSDDPLLLDLETLKVRLLLPEGAPSRDAISNGKLLLVSGDDERLQWGAVTR